MKVKQFLVFLVFGVSNLISYGQEYTLNGNIQDTFNREKLIGVNVYVKELDKGTTTNNYGYYTLSLPKGDYEISYSYVGYKVTTVTVSINGNIRQDVLLTSIEEGLEEVVISKNKQQVQIKGTEMSTNVLTGETIKRLPAVLGEVDVIKAITSLPGVSTANEATSGFNVRGGGSDQNLILMDEATLFSSSHLFGVFSIFNPDIVKDIKLYKGGIPSRYGGRLSSVLDIRQKEGNKTEFHGEGGIGSVSSRLLLEGPIHKGKTSFIVAGRASYAHLFLPLLDIDNSGRFYDFNLKLNHQINDQNSFHLSSYAGFDNFEIDGVFANNYGNRFTNVRWNHIFSNKLFLNTSLIYADYYYNFDLDIIDLRWNSDIKYFNFKTDFEHHLKDGIDVKYGLNALMYTFNPGKVSSLGDSNQFIDEIFTQRKALEGALYAEVDIELLPKLKTNLGLRFSQFFRFGEPNISIYENNQPVFFDITTKVYKEADPIDSFSLSRSKVWKDFYNLEPRIGLAYEINDSNSVKASYQRTVQYIHLISNTTTPAPLDIWEPSGGFIDPQKSDLFALGYFKNILDNDYTISTEVYYKDIQNRVNFFDGANIIANKNIERTLLFGKGRSYGLEVLFQKNQGRLQGWLAYTLSRAEELIPGRTPEETGINNGKWFASNFDKTHDLTLSANYNLNKKWKLNATFNFKTGLPVTYPTGGKFRLNSLELNAPIFGDRNAERLPSNHRLDLSANYTPKPDSKKKWKSEWIFSIYNLYNRMNATSISFERNDDTQQNEAVQLSIFGVIPAVTYNFKF